MRCLPLVAFLALAPLAGGAVGQSGSAASLTVVDATPSFWNFWDAAQDLPEAERVGRFRGSVVAAHPELFTADVLSGTPLAGNPPPAKGDEIIARYLRDVVPYIPRMRAISRTIQNRFHEYAADFTGTFPDFAPKTPVFFTVSLFSFDGATRNVGGHTALLFGIDGIARFHAPDTNLKVLFDHELFHQYHDQIAPGSNDDDQPLWMSLWEEGLATYVSQRMNPHSTESDALMSQTLAAASRPLLPALAREMLANLDSRDRAEYAAFFYSRNGRPDLPPRCGYFLGYRVAKALDKNLALPALARLQGPELKTAIRAALVKMANAGRPVSH